MPAKAAQEVTETGRLDIFRLSCCQNDETIVATIRVEELLHSARESSCYRDRTKPSSEMLPMQCNGFDPYNVVDVGEQPYRYWWFKAHNLLTHEAAPERENTVKRVCLASAASVLLSVTLLVGFPGGIPDSNAASEAPTGMYHHGLKLTMRSNQHLHKRIRLHISVNRSTFPSTAHVVLQFTGIRAWDWNGADSYPRTLPPLCDDDWGPLLVAHSSAMVAIDFGSIDSDSNSACSTDIYIFPSLRGRRTLGVKAFTGQWTLCLISSSTRTGARRGKMKTSSKL
jgi:hypothetical protein